jgi:hypothetical protein
MVQRPSSTGSRTALDSTSNLSKVEGNSFWKATTVPANVASGNMTSTARSTLIGQERKAAAAIEQRQPELPFEVRQGLADSGLRTPQAAARRETSFIRRSNKGAELIE